MGKSIEEREAELSKKLDVIGLMLKDLAGDVTQIKGEVARLTKSVDSLTVIATAQQTAMQKAKK